MHTKFRLSRGLRHPQVAQAFLEKILSQIGQKGGIDIYDLLTEEPREETDASFRGSRS